MPPSLTCIGKCSQILLLQRTVLIFPKVGNLNKFSFALSFFKKTKKNKKFFFPSSKAFYVHWKEGIGCILTVGFGVSLILDVQYLNYKALIFHDLACKRYYSYKTLTLHVAPVSFLFPPILFYSVFL